MKKSFLRRNTLLGFLLLQALLLSACGSDGSKESANGASNLTGVVTKGPVDGAIVYIYQINADGQRSETPVAGPFTTREDGSWSGSIPSDVQGPFIVVARGGVYQDETTLEDVNIGDNELTSLLPEIDDDEQQIAITPYTDALVETVLNKVSEGQAPDMAIDEVVDAAKQGFGFDPIRVLPPDPLNIPENSSEAEKKYAALLGGLTRLGDQSSVVDQVDRFELSRALSHDMLDGKLDGRNTQGKAIRITPEIQLPEVNPNGLDELLERANEFADAHPNYGNVAPPDLGKLVTLPEFRPNTMPYQKVKQTGVVELPVSVDLSRWVNDNREVMIRTKAEWDSLVQVFAANNERAIPVDFNTHLVVGIDDVSPGCSPKSIHAVKRIKDTVEVQFQSSTHETADMVCAPPPMHRLKLVVIPKTNLIVKVVYLRAMVLAQETVEQGFAVARSVSNGQETSLIDISPSQDYVVHNQEQWNKVWAQYKGQTGLTPPAVDFSTKMVVGITRTGSNGCFNIRVAEVIRTDKRTKVMIGSTPVDPESMCTQAFVSPTHFVSISKSDQPVSFEYTLRPEVVLPMSTIEPTHTVLTMQDRDFIVSNPEQWQLVWAENTGNSNVAPPMVDFARNTIIGIVRSGNNGCFKARIQRVTANDRLANVVVEQGSRESEGQMCTQAFVSRTHFVMIPRVGNEVLITTNVSANTSADTAQ